MFYSTEIKKKERVDLEKLIELDSLQRQVEDLRLQDQLGKQNFPEDMKKVFEPVTDKIKEMIEMVKGTTKAKKPSGEEKNRAFIETEDML